jgi:hypothetical protein
MARKEVLKSREPAFARMGTLDGLRKLHWVTTAEGARDLRPD